MTLVAHHIALKVNDLEKCERFYTDVLGLAVTARHHDDGGAVRSVWLDCGGTILMLERLKAAPRLDKESPGWYLLALKISPEERDGWKRKLKNAGVEIVHESPYSIYFSDPEDNWLAFSHYPTSVEER